MELDANFDQQTFLPLSIENWVAGDHPARFIRTFVASLDLKQLGFKMRKSDEGAPSYAPALLLRVWLFAYFNKVVSARGAEKMTREMMGAIWLAGNLTPDHNTLWRFWRENMGAVSALFVQMIKMAAAAQQIGFVLNAVDGTLMGCASSERSARTAEQLEQMIAHLDKTVAEIEAEILANGDAPAEAGYKISKEKEKQKAKAKKQREKAAGQLDEIKKLGKQKTHPLETDARRVGRKGKLGYNAQLVVDEKSGIVVAADLTNQATDHHQLCRMLDQAESNAGEKPEVTVADSGYARSHQELMQTEQAGHNVVVSFPEKQKDPFAASHFELKTTAQGQEILVCPQGQELALNGQTPWRYGPGQMRTFKCTAVENCPVKDQCMGNRASHLIFATPAHESVYRQQHKVTSTQRKQLMTRRRQLVERRFGHAKQNMSFRRFTYRGLQAATAQWQFFWSVENLKILWKSHVNNGFKIPEMATVG